MGEASTTPLDTRAVCHLCADNLGPCQFGEEESAEKCLAPHTVKERACRWCKPYTKPELLCEPCWREHQYDHTAAGARNQLRNFGGVVLRVGRGRFCNVDGDQAELLRSRVYIDALELAGWDESRLTPAQRRRLARYAADLAKLESQEDRIRDALDALSFNFTVDSADNLRASCRKAQRALRFAQVLLGRISKRPVPPRLMSDPTDRQQWEPAWTDTAEGLALLRRYAAAREEQRRRSGKKSGEQPESKGE